MLFWYIQWLLLDKGNKNSHEISEWEESWNENDNKDNELLAHYDQLFNSFRCEMSPSMLALLAITKATSTATTNIKA